MKTNYFNCFLSLAAMLCALLFLSCTSDIEPPPICTTGGKEHFCLSSSSSIVIVKGTFTDVRDSKTYEWVKIGTQTWMAENLNYNAAGSKCYEDDPANCAIYGRLYDWATTMNLDADCNNNSCLSQIWGICPSNWHVPSNAEWGTLMQYINPRCSLEDDCPNAGKLLKAVSGWNSGGNGTDVYGFKALPGGNGDISDGFDKVGNYSLWWSSSEYSAFNAYARGMGYDFEYVGGNFDDKSYLFSIRCVQD